MESVFIFLNYFLKEKECFCFLTLTAHVVLTLSSLSISNSGVRSSETLLVFFLTEFVVLFK